MRIIPPRVGGLDFPTAVFSVGLVVILYVGVSPPPIHGQWAHGEEGGVSFRVPLFPQICGAPRLSRGPARNPGGPRTIMEEGRGQNEGRSRPN